uniref:Uncharacterized protein n=1 Tax=Onchocerca volvulus TaxID=6282 RepID=A0A8R1XVF6_ONCVO
EYFGEKIAQKSGKEKTVEKTGTVSKFRKVRNAVMPISSILFKNQTLPNGHNYTMDLFTDKIVVLDLEEQKSSGIAKLPSQVKLLAVKLYSMRFIFIEYNRNNFYALMVELFYHQRLMIANNKCIIILILIISLFGYNSYFYDLLN